MVPVDTESEEESPNAAAAAQPVANQEDNCAGQVIHEVEVPVAAGDPLVAYLGHNNIEVVVASGEDLQGGQQLLPLVPEDEQDN